VTAVLIAVAAVVIVVVAAILVRRARRPDGVTTFQRQIDALSPEARRQVVDKVQQMDDERSAGDGP
jgi:flagellar biosynthesis/type III secretory pathway M-ring protein FliF/YscJ